MAWAPNSGIMSVDRISYAGCSTGAAAVVVVVVVVVVDVVVEAASSSVLLSAVVDSVEGHVDDADAKNARPELPNHLLLPFMPVTTTPRRRD